MSDDNQNQNLEDQNKDLTPIEEAAISKGWRPQEEWEGDEDAWVDAKTFVRQGELMEAVSKAHKKNKYLAKEVDELKLAFKQLQDHNRKVTEKQKANHEQELLALKELALEDRDHKKVVEIDQELSQLHKVETSDEVTRVDPAVEQWNIKFKDTYKEWMEKPSISKWYTADGQDKASVYAEGIGNRLIETGKYEPEEIFDKVETAVKKEFPELFKTASRSKTGSTNGTGASGKGKGKSYYAQLSADAKRVADNFAKFDTTFDKEKYAKEVLELA